MIKVVDKGSLADTWNKYKVVAKGVQDIIQAPIKVVAKPFEDKDPISPLPTIDTAEAKGFISPVSELPKEVKPSPTPTPTPSPTSEPPDYSYKEEKIPEYVPEKFVNTMDSAASEYGISLPLLAKLFDVESVHYNDKYIYGPATSPKGAMGIAQFMPIAIKELARLGYNEGKEINPWNPDEAIPASAFFLGSLLKQTGNMRDALAAYNAGLGNIEAGYGYADNILNSLK